jgi:hypothetical protein
LYSCCFDSTTPFIRLFFYYMHWRLIYCLKESHR